MNKYNIEEVNDNLLACGLSEDEIKKSSDMIDELLKTIDPEKSIVGQMCEIIENNLDKRKISFLLTISILQELERATSIMGNKKMEKNVENEL